MVKTTDLVLIGGVGLAAAFFLGLFGKPEEGEKPLGIGFPDFSFLADLFSGAVAIPDLGASFFEGLTQQLAALQEQIGAAGTTIINLPAEAADVVTDAIDDVVDAVGGGVQEFSLFGETLIDWPSRVAGGIAEKAAAAIPVFDVGAGILSGIIGAALGIPLGPGAIVTGLGAFAAGGFGAVPLSKVIPVAPLAIPLAVPGGLGMPAAILSAAARAPGPGTRVGITPKSPTAKAPPALGGYAPGPSGGVVQYTVLTPAARRSLALFGRTF